MTVLDTWAKLRRQLDAQAAKVLERIINAYGMGYERITPEINSLVEYMDQLDKAGKLTSDAVKKSAAYKNLNKAVEIELTDYQAYLRTEISTAASAAAESGITSGRMLLLAAIADALGVAIGDVPPGEVKPAPPDALAFLAEYLRKDGPLFQKIDELSGFHAERISAGILEQVGLGKNPRTIASWITDAYGVPLVDSLRTTRTVQLYSYRSANLATMKANDDVVIGWTWVAELDDLCCVVCVTMHGTEHSLDETMDSHYNCRCSPAPLVKGTSNSIEQTGVDWLNEQNESAQRQVLGAKYDGWKNGDFQLTDIIGNHESDVYGNMLVEKPLKDL